MDKQFRCCVILIVVSLLSCNNGIFSSFSDLDMEKGGTPLSRIMSLIPVIQRYEYPLTVRLEPDDLKDDITLFAVYVDGSIRELQMEKVTITYNGEEDFNSSGEKHITVAYQEKKAFFTIIRRDPNGSGGGGSPNPSPGGDGGIGLDIKWGK